jgi:hypothetical protein
VQDTVAAVPTLEPDVRRALTTAAVSALAGTLLGAGALVAAVLLVVAGTDLAISWMIVALALPTAGYWVAWSHLMSAWTSSDDRVRYFTLLRSRPFALVSVLCGFWALLSPVVALGVLVWLVVRLISGANGWLGVAVPFVVVAALAALGTAFTVTLSHRQLGQSILTFAMFERITDEQIEWELAGSARLGGSPDWSSFWQQRIARFTADPPVDRPARDCTDYIISARAAAGLPPLDA